MVFDSFCAGKILYRQLKRSSILGEGGGERHFYLRHCATMQQAQIQWDAIVKQVVSKSVIQLSTLSSIFCAKVSSCTSKFNLSSETSNAMCFKGDTDAVTCTSSGLISGLVSTTSLICAI